MKFLWKFENLNHRQKTTCNYTRYISQDIWTVLKISPAANSKQTTTKDSKKGFYEALIAHRNFPPTAIFACAYLFLYHAVTKKNLSQYLSCPPETLVGKCWVCCNTFSCFSLHQCAWICYKFSFIVARYNGFNVAYNQNFTQHPILCQINKKVLSAYLAVRVLFRTLILLKPNLFMVGYKQISRAPNNHSLWIICSEKQILPRIFFCLRATRNF